LCNSRDFRTPEQIEIPEFAVFPLCFGLRQHIYNPKKILKCFEVVSETLSASKCSEILVWASSDTSVSQSKKAHRSQWIRGTVPNLTRWWILNFRIFISLPKHLEERCEKYNTPYKHEENIYAFFGRQTMKVMNITSLLWKKRKSAELFKALKGSGFYPIAKSPKNGFEQEEKVSQRVLELFFSCTKPFLGDSADLLFFRVLSCSPSPSTYAMGSLLYLFIHTLNRTETIAIICFAIIGIHLVSGRVPFPKNCSPWCFIVSRILWASSISSVPWDPRVCIVLWSLFTFVVIHANFYSYMDSEFTCVLSLLNLDTVVIV
jgi:hypothetical protein